MIRAHRRRFALLIALLGAVAVPAAAQTAEDPTTVVGLNILGPVLGLYSASVEHAIDDELTIFAIPTYFNAKAGLFDALASVADIEREDYDLWFLSVAAGTNYFVNGAAVTGVFAGVWVQPGYGAARLERSALDPEAEVKFDGWTALLGAGAHVGYRLVWGPVAITPRVGISYQFSFTEVTGFKTEMRNLVDAVNTGLRFPWGIDVGIAF